MVRTMSTVLHRTIREAIAGAIERGEIPPGARLPSERRLQEEWNCARSVVRQALAALVRDGWIMSLYPRGYVVVGPRIPWISRLRPLAEEGWAVTIVDVGRTAMPATAAEALLVPSGSPAIVRLSRLAGATSGRPWGLGAVYYPAGALSEDAAALLLAPGEITYDTLEAAFGRRIVGYREQIRARVATPEETEALAVKPGTPVLEVARLARTTTAPISAFTFVGRADLFEADYLLEA